MADGARERIGGDIKGSSQGKNLSPLDALAHKKPGTTSTGRAT
jgi:hypothetical protein